MVDIDIVNFLTTQEVIELPLPGFSGELPLMQVLKARRSTHAFSSEGISDKQLSELLWAANGVNRRISHKGRKGMRTAPSAKNHQEIEIFVFLRCGIYKYDALGHSLIFVKAGDQRAACGMQAFFADAPMALCLVADFSKMGNYDEKKRAFYSGIDAGYVSQNIYLYCASEGLATTACGLIDRKNLYLLLKLDDAKAIISHPVGRAKEESNRILDTSCCDS
jgi:SagB-type dehydrogenase family enzyme